jgi:hypothetical protein
MAYNTQNMVSQCFEVIKEKKLIWIEEIFAFVPFCKATFYNKKLDELDSIKKALEDNRIEMKAVMRVKWLVSDNPTLQLALYRLIATPEEFDRLNVQRINHTSKGESMRTIEIHVDSKEEAEEYKSLIDHISKIN